jgi:hypothetical protein
MSGTVRLPKAYDATQIRTVMKRGKINSDLSFIKTVRRRACYLSRFSLTSKQFVFIVNVLRLCLTDTLN